MTLPNTMLVSLQKSGTHLLSGLAEKIGYQVAGTVVGKEPVIPESEELRVMSFFYSEDEMKEIAEGSEENRKAKLQLAFGWLLSSWSLRTGSPLASRHTMCANHTLHNAKDPIKVMMLPFDALPHGICWVKHELPLSRCDGQFISSWARTGEPRVIFNYRDPRDILISFVNYLTRQTAQKTFGNFAEYYVYNGILEQLPDMESRLKLAILDPHFPGHRDFEESLWMYQHPKICKVSFEELVGARGGGCDTQREQAVARILKHLDCDLEPSAVAEDLFNPNTFTFNRGQIGVWREVFSDDLHRAFNKRFGDITEAYGYELHVP